MSTNEARCSRRAVSPSLAQNINCCLTMRIQVAKGSSALVFACASDGDLMTISHIAHESADADVEEDDNTSSYTGPVFEELDDTLQQAFLDYLEERGITAELGCYLRLQTVEKTTVEYQAWLARVKDFVSLE
eukprot:297846-Chlamydomonas_euryale.AAC.11